MATLGARLQRDQPGRCEVPDIEAFVVAFQPSHGHEADVQGRRTDAANIGAIAQDCVQAGDHWPQCRFDIGKACCD